MRLFPLALVMAFAAPAAAQEASPIAAMSEISAAAIEEPALPDPATRSLNQSVIDHNKNIEAKNLAAKEAWLREVAAVKARGDAAMAEHNKRVAAIEAQAALQNQRIAEWERKYGSKSGGKAVDQTSGSTVYANITPMKDQFANSADDETPDIIVRRKKDPIVCKGEDKAPTGSLIVRSKVERLCLKESEWDRRRREGNRDARAFVVPGGGCPNPETCMK